MILRTRLLWIATTLMLLTLCVFRAGAAEGDSGNKPRSRQELRADRHFIKGDYNRAMKLYEKAHDALTEDNMQKYTLRLKMARLYTALQQPGNAIRHYDEVYNSADTMLTVNDVCFFVDALRQDGQNQRAEVIVRNITFRNVYSRNQRYINTLHSLSNQQHYYAKGNDPCVLEMVDKSGSLPEYWLGKWDGKLFYAVSHSPLQDPRKIFYHRTQYFSLDDETVMPFHSIPRELQSGPVAFSDNGSIMVATGISYRDKGTIVNPGEDGNMFVTQLYYSLINSKSGGWSSFKPLFDYQEGYSYAHPTFFNDGKSLVFASDRPGGYGGMDLYMADWNETTLTWDDPVNLGGLVNTEGDETYPRIIGGALYFSSNGHEGFGGYDMYRVTFDRKIVLPGTFYHYPYPVNTTFNDFGMLLDGDTGYLVSDRRGAGGKEDIYRFDNVALHIGRDDFSDVSQEYEAMRGNLNLISGLKASNTEQYNKSLNIYTGPEDGDILLSIYFNFNSYGLDQAAAADLRALLSDAYVKNMQELYVVGYADEFGTRSYNQKLSEERAYAVAQYLWNNRIVPELFVEGRGQLQLSEADYQTAAQQYTAPYINANRELDYSRMSIPLDDQIRINRVLRRVDIIVKKK